MAIFGSSWNDNNEDIGPMSHWLEDFSYSEIEDDNSDKNSPISKSIKNKELKLRKPTRKDFINQIALSKKFELEKSIPSGYDLNKVGGFKKKINGK